jgi:hypothetical protein
MYKIIVKDNLCYVARTLSTEEADTLAKANGLQYAELFTRKYKDCTLHVEPNGRVIRDLSKDKTPHFITEV